MRMDNAVVDGFKPKSKHPGRKAVIGRKIYPWMRNPEGRIAKVSVQMLAEKWIDAPALVMGRRLAENGVTPARLLTEFTAIFPEFPEVYLLVTGKPLTGKVLYHRVHKGLTEYNSKTGVNSPKISREHYTSSPELRRVAAAATNMVKSAKPVTLAQMVAGGTI